MDLFVGALLILDPGAEPDVGEWNSRIEADAIARAEASAPVSARTISNRRSVEMSGSVR